MCVLIARTRHSILESWKINRLVSVNVIRAITYDYCAVQNASSDDEIQVRVLFNDNMVILPLRPAHSMMLSAVGYMMRSKDRDKHQKLDKFHPSTAQVDEARKSAA